MRSLSLSLLAFVLILTGCRGTNSGSDNDGGGEVSVSITSSGLENTFDVNIRITAVRFFTDGDDMIEFPVSGRRQMIDLLEFDGTERDDLIDEEDLPAGRYTRAEIVMDPSMISLRDDRGNQFDLTLLGPPTLSLNVNFLVEADDEFDFVVVFDPRKSISRNPMDNSLQFNPRFRVADADETGTITGSVSRDLLDDNSCDDNNENDDNVVYLFNGSGARVQDIMEMDGNEELGNPIATTLAESMSNTDDLQFTFGFLPVGSYTLAFTCNAVRDNPLVMNTDVEFSDPVDFMLTRSGSMGVMIQ